MSGCHPGLKLVVHPRVSDDWLRRIRAVSPDLRVVDCESEPDAERELAAADAFYGTITPRLLRAARQLRQAPVVLTGAERLPAYPFTAPIVMPLTNHSERNT
jgi:hypothetical protein